MIGLGEGVVYHVDLEDGFVRMRSKIGKITYEEVTNMFYVENPEKGIVAIPREHVRKIEFKKVI